MRAIGSTRTPQPRKEWLVPARGRGGYKGRKFQEEAVPAHALDRLLVTLDVAVEAFAICEVQARKRLILEAVDAVVVHYVLAGTMHLTTSSGGPLICTAGTVVIVPPGLSQGLAADDMPAADVQSADHCSMERDGLLLLDAAEGADGTLRVVCGTITATVSGSFGLIDNIGEPVFDDMSGLVIVRNAFAVMLDEISNPGLGSKAMTSALMKTCLVMLLRRSALLSGATGALLDSIQDPRLGRAVAAVLQAPAARHTVADLSAIAGMGRSTFARNFTGTYAMSPMEFVAKTRLHHAAEMLRSTTLPVKVVAASIGFASRSHFSRAFRDAYGLDPTQFRRRSGKHELDSPAHLRGTRRRFALEEEPVAAA